MSERRTVPVVVYTKVVDEIDDLVRKKTFPSRSRFFEMAAEEKLQKMKPSNRPKTFKEKMIHFLLTGEDPDKIQ